MSEQDLLLIEQYYRNALSEAESLAFEQRMADDEAFRAEALSHKKALLAIELYGKEQMKKKLRERPLVKADRLYRVWPWMLGICTLILLMLFWRIESQKQLEKPTEPVTPSTSPTTPIPSGTAKPLPQQADNDNIKQTTNTQKLFATAYHPFQEGGTGNNVRSNGQNPDPDKMTGLNQLKQLALEQKHAECLEAYEKLPAGTQQKEMALFFKANSLLALGRTDEAAGLFEGVASSQQSAYASHAQWYAALCALKTGDLPKAKKWLQELGSNNNASAAQRTKAKNLLRQLR